MSEEAKLLVKKLNTVQRTIVRTQSYATAWDKDTVSIVEVRATLDDIVAHKTKLVTVFEDLSDICTADEMKTYDGNLNTLFSGVRTLHTQVGQLLADKESALKSKTSPSFKLERITLPKFSGAISEWQSFHDLFKTSVDRNPTLSGGEKLIHLKSSLISDAGSIISSFQVTDSNYQQAWDLVVKRYSNKRELVFAHIRKLDELKHNNEESASGLRIVTDTVNECVRSLTCLGVPVDKWDLIIIFLVLKKVSKETRKEWLLKEKATLPALDKFVEYLETRARALADSEKPSRPRGSQSNQSSSKNKSSSHVVKSSQLCVKCSDSHHLYKCQSFLDSSPAERKELVMNKSLCFNCLFHGHSVANCRMNFSCRKCGQKHHTLLHSGPSPEQSSSAASTSVNDTVPVPEEPQSVISSHSCPHVSNTNLVLLGTLLVSVGDSAGVQQKCRVFMDPGSESNFITEHCVDRLGLKRKKTCVNITGISGSSAETSTGIVNLTLYSHVRDFNISIKSLVLKKITSKLPRAACQSQWSHIQDLQLGDPSFNRPSHIDILLGAGDAASIMIPGIRHGPSGSPTAQNKQFGWMLSGYIQQQSMAKYNIKVHSNHSCCNYDDRCLDASLTKFWELENEPDSSLSLSQEEEACESHFQKTVHRDPDGSYTVELPFKEDPSTTGQSHLLALRRFNRVESRLIKNPEIKQEYIRCMRESLSANFMELIPEEEVESSQVYYMPHREVVKESSSTTKVRIVYDASAKSASGVSLNDILMTGPKLQIDLVPLLIRFRSHRVAMSADITKFYPQFRVNRKHIDYQRLLWREDISLPIQDYRLLRVTFGVTSAPFLAIRCLQQLAEDESQEFPRAAEVIKHEFLVDNLLSGSDDIESALLLQSEILEVMSRGNLKLTKWASNYNQILQVVPQNQREVEDPLSIEDTKGIKTIGLLWNPTSDSFGVSVNVPTPSQSITKRKVLSTIAKTFDPCGWITPVTVRGKIFMQELWKYKLEWDGPLPANLSKLWTSYCNDLTQLSSFRISRCIVDPCLGSNREYELHGFSDASLSAYSASVYLKSIGENNNFVNLVISKTKVAPVKSETIPRLELCGAALLSKLINTVQASLNLQFRSIRCWTDSTIVLDLLASDGKLPVFIANRVRKIKSNISVTKWSHVSGIENPADAASRGISTQALLQSKLWLQGPPWLLDTKFEVQPIVAMSLTVQKEES